MTAKEIRQAFLSFFESKQHHVVPSAPIVVKNDPTLMFTNAGMNQFKDLFLGEAAIKYSRVADTQRCLRVSGKHNDLEEVGIDTYHHTMFEMLGNWSFGDYFKKEAIAWSWELLTEVYKIPKEKLYVTYFEGDKKEGLEKDQEAYDLWKQYVDESHILPGNKKDNFWEMGDTGPCGPCSEIHVDCRTDEEKALVDGATLVNADHPQVIEIWNNVFMQFNRLKNGSLQSLPAKHVDTGMGFERLVRVLQEKTSNYDTDVFQPMIQFIAEKSGIKYGADEKTDIAMRVMADHIRAISFVIADGQLPSNNKAGYVIRRILRRAVRYAYTFLNFKEPFLNQLVPLLAEQFKGVFDELISQQDFVQKVVLEEEVSFLRTLSTGIQRFEKYQASNDVVEGNFAFELSDTFGFPIDLTELMAREKGWSVDLVGYEQALKKQKDDSRAATAIDTGDWIVVNTEEQSEFVGYDDLEIETEILKYRKVKAKGKEQYQIVLRQTPFYAESGGQVGDTGRLEDHSRQFWVDITDTKKENGLTVHFTDILPDNLEGKFWAVVDEDKRVLTEDNHSATHLLHAALKQVLGKHVNQKGSLVNADYLRFDFSHFAKVTDEELAQIEVIVNQKIRQNIKLKEQRNVPYQDAIESGVTALFGEKYGDFVRMITFDDHFSKELCGGTHVKATGQIGSFKIVSESAVAAGVRRIEAITADKAEQYFLDQRKELGHLKALLNGSKDLSASVQALLDENAKLKKEIEKSTIERVNTLKHEIVHHVRGINGINLIAKHIDLQSADAVKNLAFSLKDMVDNLFLVFTTEIDGKPGITVMLSDHLVKKGLNASNIVRELGKEIQGGGGGQPFYATAGGKNPSGLKVVLEKAESFIPHH
ncbi:Alanine--tRNA ligase [Pedobacter sp. Bi27]|uniref:alanine--tRNA ligase n=1 Tax=unclassified Pedobacter TaxID=2628915 RepID=UPI001DBDD900|nr:MULTISPECIES: alanine--tRNA ligase [unclassified Pedobacter]CAH0145338.1 Alanine--tRNA ligase [Pedobacter sp. Bi36]CAH0201205.1 Alanine--tRNA ligase [Pedobacter sp. Bi126]CAH0259825.1 Alanine--tRNA ligase [Pedobacter sp. Bi27]